MSYNGYKNYQTWNVALWLDNDYGLYTNIRTMARGKNVGQLADYIESLVEDMNPLAEQASMFSDVLGNALAHVDWYEIAENILEE